MSNYGDYNNKPITPNLEPTKEMGTTSHLSTSQSTLEHTIAGRQATKSSPSLFSKFKGLFRSASSGTKTAEEASASQSRRSTTMLKSSSFAKMTSIFRTKNPSATNITESTPINTNIIQNNAMQQSILKKTPKKTTHTTKISNSFKKNPKNLENIGKVDRNEIDGLLPLYKTPEGKAAMDSAAESGWYDHSTKFLNDYIEIEKQLKSLESSQDQKKLLSLQEKLKFILRDYIAPNDANISGVTREELMKFAGKSITKEDIPNIKRLLEQVKVESCVMVINRFRTSPEFKELKSAVGLT